MVLIKVQVLDILGVFLDESFSWFTSSPIRTEKNIFSLHVILDTHLQHGSGHGIHGGFQELFGFISPSPL
jgi:hypothetical protein